jgi:hypothetical protein
MRDKVVERLLAVLALIERRESWLPESEPCVAQDGAGTRCSASAAEAVRWSWRGAVYRVAPSLADREAIFAALDLANNLLARPGDGHIFWEHREVLAIFRRAVALSMPARGRPAASARRTPSQPSAS